MKWSLRGAGAIVSVIILLCSHIAEAQVPRVCAHNVTHPLKQCCPISARNGQVCGGQHRGECVPLAVYREPVEPIFQMDDRLEWPRRFFHSLCQCRGNFWGVACDECNYGWRGPDCSEKVVYVRRNIMTYSPHEKHMFQKIVMRSDQIESDYLLLLEEDVYHSDPLVNPRFITTSIHKYIVATHRYASRATLFDNPNLCEKAGYLDYNHGVVMFSVWHRYYILLWERFLRDIAEREFGIHDFTVPYWDWIDATSCDVCTNDLVGSTGEFDPRRNIYLLSRGSVFRNFTEYCQTPKKSVNRCVGCHFSDSFQPLNRFYRATAFPTTPELEYIMSKKDFYVPNEGPSQCQSFHKAFEGFCGPEHETSSYLWMHNKVHNMVKGSFCCAATAANDPLFILHHSQVDRILQAWIMVYRPDPQTILPTRGVRPGQFRDSNLVGFIPTIKNKYLLVDLAKFGVVYDNYRFGKRGTTFVPTS